MTELVSYSVEQDVSTIRLERPEKLNAMTIPMWEAVTAGIEQANDDGVRAIILTGTGDVFCAGDDIAALANIEDEQDVRALTEALLTCWDAIESSPTPVIGRANGSAYGGGFELLLAADVSVVPEDATFQLPETRIGAYPFYAAKRLARLVGRQRAMDLAVFGREVSGVEAEQWGLFARAVPESKLDAEVEQLVDALRASSPSATATTKEWLNATLELPGEDLGMRTGLGYLFSGPDAHEGAEAFLEKRDPDFSG